MNKLYIHYGLKPHLFFVRSLTNKLFIMNFSICLNHITEHAHKHFCFRKSYNSTQTDKKTDAYICIPNT